MEEFQRACGWRAIIKTNVFVKTPYSCIINLASRMGTSTFHTRPGQRFLAFALVAALYVCTSATAAVEASEPNPADEHQLLVKLETMRVKEPTAVLTAMHVLGLEHDDDFAILNDGEREEMISGLGAQGISLGDRSKARQYFGALQGRTTGEHAFADNNIADAGDIRPHDREFFRAPRRMQDSGGEGTNFDTLAIALSVLVGAAGSMVQAWSTRRAERSAADRALDLQHSELTRQREHEQMVAQIGRTERWLDECCRPVDLGIESLTHARYCYVAHTVFEMEASHPEVVAEMLALSAAMFPVGADGKVTSARSGTLYWERSVPTQLTMAFGSNLLAMPSAAACSVRIVDTVLTYAKAFCDELPQAILDVVAAEPTGAIAHSYRRYIRTVWVPGVQHVAELLKAHSAVIEWPTIEWLAKKFPQIPWRGNANNLFATMWIAYAISWDRVLAEWKEAENFAVVRPTCGQPAAVAGLSQAIAWSRTRGEAAQKELIGMTAEAEVDTSFFSTYGATTSSTAGAATTFEAEDT
jgi:hypothetical protein